MSVRLMAVGDMFLEARDGKQDPFAYVKDVFGEADIVFGNLEVPLTDADVPSLEQAVLLKSSPESVSFLKEAHFSVLSIAHNHIRDFGDEGALDTIRHLQNAGIQYIGAGRTMSECTKEGVINVKRMTVSFIGFYAFGEGLSSNRLHIAGMIPSSSCIESRS